MRRFVGIGIAMWISAACDGGPTGASGQIETVGTLPVDASYEIGFAADGAPLLGMVTSDSAILRFDGSGWSPLAGGRVFRVGRFSSDLDGAPLVLHQIASALAVEVWRIEADGAAVQLGARVAGYFQQVTQGASGTRYLVGESTRVLRSGSSTWEPYPLELQGAVRDGDGRLYATAGGDIVRIEDNDEATVLLECTSPLPCFAPPVGIDDRGRLYAQRMRATLLVFDTVQRSASPPFTPPGWATLHRARVATFGVVAVGSTFEDPSPSVFTMAPDSFSMTPVVSDRSFGGGGPIGVHIDPAGAAYLTQDDWLGRLAL